jgi:hypothetical protein
MHLSPCCPHGRSPAANTPPATSLLPNPHTPGAPPPQPACTLSRPAGRRDSSCTGPLLPTRPLWTLFAWRAAEPPAPDAPAGCSLHLRAEIRRRPRLEPLRRAPRRVQAPSKRPSLLPGTAVWGGSGGRTRRSEDQGSRPATPGVGAGPGAAGRAQRRTGPLGRHEAAGGVLAPQDQDRATPGRLRLPFDGATPPCGAIESTGCPYKIDLRPNPRRRDAALRVPPGAGAGSATRGRPLPSAARHPTLTSCALQPARRAGR